MRNDIKPGTPEAIEAGCLCQPRDGEAILNERFPLWAVQGCPLHDPTYEADPEGATKRAPQN